MRKILILPFAIFVVGQLIAPIDAKEFLDDTMYEHKYSRDCNRSYEDEKEGDKVLKKIVCQCHSNSKALLDSGITAQMQKGAISNAQCLISNIEELTADFFIDNDQQKQLLDKIQQLRKVNFEISKEITQENIHCAKNNCGTMYDLFPYGYDLDILEGVLRRIIYEKINHRTNDQDSRKK